MTIKLVHFLAIVLTALILAPGGAHLFEMPAKIRMDEAAYFTVQRIYAGWALFAVPIFAVIGLDAALAWMLRGQGLRFWLVAGALAAIVLTLVIFFAMVFPGNQATSNWTVVTENWEALRRSWETGHAINAGITFVSLSLLTAAAFLPESAAEAGSP